jgi:hypothetical protein
MQGVEILYGNGSFNDKQIILGQRFIKMEE